jgi:Ca-activated chloride channel family protein
LNAQIELNAALATPIILAGQKQKAYLRIGLTGHRLKNEKVAPLNVVLVIDKSSSMQGEKIRQAKEAALMVLERLRKNDIFSVVTYDHRGEILLPATPAQEKDIIKTTLNRMRAGGQTALYDGIEKGAKEIQKFLDRNRINRIILISDGQANVGPNSLDELGELATSLGQENIVITTIGLGLSYHEDLLTVLAKKSDGNHIFVEQASNLVHFFDFEFSDLFSVVAQEVTVTLIGVNGVRIIRVLGREATIQGQEISVKLNQLYSCYEKYVLVELEVPPCQATEKHVLAGAAVVYRKMNACTTDRVSTIVTASFSESPEKVEEKTNRIVMTAVAEQLAVEKNKQAVKLRDEGEIKNAQQLLLNNVDFLSEEAAKYGSENLKKLKEINLKDANHLDQKSWVKQRKSMRRQQYKSETQQNY